MIYESDEMDDNMVYIRKNLDTNEFLIRYMDANGGKPIVHELSSLYSKKVLDYVYYLLKNQYLDEEGFSQFQVNMPGMPRMIVSGEKFKDVYYREHFHELLAFGLDTLETAHRIHLPKSVDPIETARKALSQTDDSYMNASRPACWDCNGESGEVNNHQFFY
jgi:hypothetical protein